MQLPVYNLAGETVREIEMSDYVFAAPFNEGVVHQVLVAQRANARQGTAATKTRSEVKYSTRKLFRQKGTGNARAGSRRSPLRRGGGITFGPQPRDYRQSVPVKMRRLALRCVLSAKARDGNLKIVDGLTFDRPSTKEMRRALEALGASSSVLVVTNEPETNVIKSARNLPGIRTTPAPVINVADLLSHRTLLMTEPAVRTAEKLWGQPSRQRSHHVPA